MLPDGFGCRVGLPADRVLVQVRHSVTQRVDCMVRPSEIATTVNQLRRTQFVQQISAGRGHYQSALGHQLPEQGKRS
jgi:hypothetical protein